MSLAVRLQAGQDNKSIHWDQVWQLQPGLSLAINTKRAKATQSLDNNIAMHYASRRLKIGQDTTSELGCLLSKTEQHRSAQHSYSKLKMPHTR